MFPGDDVKFSDGWWAQKLHNLFTSKIKGAELESIGYIRKAEYSRKDWCDLLWNVYSGNSPLPGYTNQFVEQSRNFMLMSRVNYANTVVSALKAKTRILGARTENDSGDEGNEAIRKAVTRSASAFDDIFSMTYSMGAAAMMVGYGEEDENDIIITAEDPRSVSWSTDPRTGKVRAAMKRYSDPDLDMEYAILYIGAVGEERYVKYARSTLMGRWEVEERGPLPLQGYGLPIVPIVNENGMGEFERELGLLERISNNIADRMYIQKSQAYLLQAFIGEFPDIDPMTNEKIDYDNIFTRDPATILRLPTGTIVHEGKAVDLTPLLSANIADLRELSTVTRTPFSMFQPDASNQSAEGARATKDSFISKCRDRITLFTPNFAEVFRLVLAHSGSIEDAKGIEPIWAEPDIAPVIDKYKSATFAKAVGLPFESILVDVLDMTPDQVNRIKATKRRETIYYGEENANQNVGSSGGPADQADNIVDSPDNGGSDSGA